MTNFDRFHNLLAGQEQAAASGAWIGLANALEAAEAAHKAFHIGLWPVLISRADSMADPVVLR